MREMVITKSASDTTVSTETEEIASLSTTLKNTKISSNMQRRAVVVEANRKVRSHHHTQKTRRKTARPRATRKISL